MWAARGFWILDSGSWAVGGTDVGARILYSVFWKLGRRGWQGSTGVGRPDSVFWILEAGASRVAGPPGFCILHSVFCRRHVHVMHMHGSTDGT